MLGAFAAGVPVRLRHLQIPVTAADPITLTGAPAELETVLTMRLETPEVEALQAMGLSLRFYAVFIVGLEAALAVARLGTARGISAFERYGYIERNGQSNLAVPLGRWRVPRPGQGPGPVYLLESIEPWVEQLRRSDIPALERAARRVEEAMLAVCRAGGPNRWQELLVRLGEAEDAIDAVLKSSEAVELSPQNAYIRRLQHQMAERANLVSRSRGREPFRRVRLYPDAARSTWR